MTTILNVRRRASKRHLYFIGMMQCRNICRVCKLQFFTMMDLNLHMDKNHAEMFFICNCCNDICNTWLLFLRHNTASHKNIVFCPYCYKPHTDYMELRLHWRMHEPYECEICYNTFKTLSNLRDHHLSLHHKVPFDLNRIKKNKITRNK